MSNSPTDLGFSPADVVAKVEARLAPGLYDAKIESATIAPTKGGDKAQLTLVLRCGSVAVWDRIIVRLLSVTPTDKEITALQIGQERCKKLWAAAQIGGTDVAALIGKVVGIKVDLEAASGAYPEKNRVRDYVLPSSGGVPSIGAATPARRSNAPVF